jgi:outer membrane protein OmpA-like peptidoglycan-associated protein
MSRLINGRTRAQHAVWNRWHGIVATLLALLLVVLWLTGRGPGSAAAGGTCCGKARSVVIAPPVAEAPLTPLAPILPLDSDGDGVSDVIDRCPGTPTGDRVGEHGCTCEVTVQLQYGLDSAELTAADKLRLDAVAEQLRRLNFESGEVGGYSDSTGDEAYNLRLSQRRAQAALDYLASRGIAAGRMTAVGYGEANPIADNATPEGRALNRRAVYRRSDCGPPDRQASPSN